MISNGKFMRFANSAYEKKNHSICLVLAMYKIQYFLLHLAKFSDILAFSKRLTVYSMRWTWIIVSRVIYSDYIVATNQTCEIENNL